MSGLSGLSAAVSVPEQWTGRHVRCCLAEGREGRPGRQPEQGRSAGRTL
jgi:hypothetical protein